MVYQDDAFYEKPVLVAEFSDGYKRYYANVDRLLSDYQLGQKVTVIYEPKNPRGAKQYTFLGYWMGLNELFWSLLLLAVSWSAAYSITKNPTPEALLEQLEYKEPDKPRYD